MSLIAAAPAQATGTLAWPHFLRIHVASRSPTTRIVLDTAYAGIRWASQPGVAADDYRVRVDSTGYVRSLDGKLAFHRQVSTIANDLRVVIDGQAWTFVPTPGALGASFLVATSTPPGPNTVTDLDPNTSGDNFIPKFKAPMDFEVYVRRQCRSNQFIAVAVGWENRIFASAPGPNAPPNGSSPLPGNTPPGAYRLRWTGTTVVALNSGLTFTQLPGGLLVGQNSEELAVGVVHSCDPAGDGTDVTGFDHHPGDDTLTHQTSFAEAPPFDAGYGWQPYNSSAAQPRESFAECNVIVLVSSSKDPRSLGDDPLCQQTTTQAGGGSQPGGGGGGGSHSGNMGGVSGANHSTPPCFGLAGQSAAFCAAGRRHNAALRACASIKRARKRAACVTAETRAFRRALARIRCQTLKGKKQLTCVRNARARGYRAEPAPGA